MNDDLVLEAALRDLGGAVAWPRSRDLWPAVRERIAVTQRAPWWNALRSPRYGFTPALVALAVLLATALAFTPAARSAAEQLLRIGGIEIFRVPPTPVPTPLRSASPSAPTTAAPTTPPPTVRPASFGDRVPLAEARARVVHPLLMPAGLGDPDEVYVRPVPGDLAVTFVWRPRSGSPTQTALPESSIPGVGAALTQFRGGLETGILFKAAGPGTRVEELTVNGGRGAWLAGTPHEVFYRDAVTGNFTNDTLRLAGNTLVWEQASLTVRLEAAVDKATALQIASTVR